MARRRPYKFGLLDTEHVEDWRETLREPDDARWEVVPSAASKQFYTS